MELSNRMLKYPELVALLEKLRSIPKFPVGDVIAVLKLMESKMSSDEALEKRIHVAYVMCMRMEPSAEDIISALLQTLYRAGEIDSSDFAAEHLEKRFDRYCACVAQAAYEWVYSPDLSDEAAVDHYIMMRVCDNMFKTVLAAMKKHHISDTAHLHAVYDYVKKAYYWDRRDSEEPYLIHLIAMARHIAEQGMESAVIAATLLYQMNDRSKEEIGKKFGMQIVKYIEAVASMYPSSEGQGKTVAEEAQALKPSTTVIDGPSRIIALYIKAADNLCKLKALGTMPGKMKFEVIDEIEIELLPLLRDAHMDRQVRLLEDLIWKIGNIKIYEPLEQLYKKIFIKKQPYIEAMKDLLEKSLCHDIRYTGLTVGAEDIRFQITVEVYQYLTQEMYQMFKTSETEIITHEDITSGTLRHTAMPLCDLDIIVEPSDKVNEFIKLFMKLYTRKGSQMPWVITDYQKDEYGRFIITVVDDHRTIFRLCISSKVAYELCRIGHPKLMVSEDPEGVVSASGNICIRLRNGKRILLPEGSTAIDVAFAIHPEMGLSITSAEVNGSQRDVTSRLHDGDKVIVTCDTYREQGITQRITYHAQLNWLRYVASDRAKKEIVKYLNIRFETEGPKSESDMMEMQAEHLPLPKEEPSQAQDE